MNLRISRPGVFLIAVIVGSVAALAWIALDRSADDRPPGDVSGHDLPGWDALSSSDRRRAATELTDEAREWLRSERHTVLSVARRFDVSPVALGGIVAAEKTLLVGRVDAIGEELFRAVFGSLRDADLARWVADQEAAFRRDAFGGAGESGVVRSPYLWTLGPAQVSFRLAVQYEPRIASRLDRPERNPKEVLEAMTTVSGNLEYAAALLDDARQAYLEVADHDISDRPGVLATLYHLGAPRVRARRLAEENEARRRRGEAELSPQVNFYGAFVGIHAAEIDRLLRSEGEA